MKVLFIILIYIIFYFKNIYYNLFTHKIEKNRNHKIYIIGDYLSGLITAWNLQKNGFKPIILSPNEKINDPFLTMEMDNSRIPIQNYMWPKEKNEHWRELLDELDIKKKNINRSFHIKSNEIKYIHGVNTETSIKYKYEISQWLKMVDFCKTLNKSFNMNGQFNLLNIIQLRYITKIYKCDDPIFIKEIIQNIYYDYPDILSYPISLLEYINDIIPIDNSKFPEYETFLDINETEHIISRLTNNIKIIYNCDFKNIKYKNKDKQWEIKCEKEEFIADNIIYNCNIDTLSKLNNDQWTNKLISLFQLDKSKKLYIQKNKDILIDKNPNYMTYVDNGNRIENLSIWNKDTFIIYDQDKIENNVFIEEEKLNVTYENSILIKLLDKLQGKYGRYYLGKMNLINNRNDINVQIMNGIKISMMIGCEYPFIRLIDKYKYL
tara:strand:- start:2454 stop:3758 length:1305 start_codon:yes stop_codon:yes gene_type:complete